MSATVFDLDDLCPEFDPWEELHALKEKHPGLKVTLFAIPSRCVGGFLDKYSGLDWVELAVHGYHHSQRECAVWSYDEAASKLAEIEEWWPGPKLFKAPGWQYNEEVYKALLDGGWMVADHAAYAWPSMNEPINRFTHNLPGVNAAHGHTWEVSGNGPSVWNKLLEGAGPEFKFVSEACEVKRWGYKDIGAIQLEETSWSHSSQWGAASWKKFSKLFADIDPSETIGDFGGNDGTNAKLGRDEMGLDVTVIEGSPVKVQYADGSGVKAICANLEDLSVIPDGAYDWGYTSHTLEHIDDILGAWEEIKRCCKKGVYVVLPVESQEHFEKCSPTHVHRADHEGWCELLGMERIGGEEFELIARWLR